MNSNTPIGVFDSGLGGLSVLKEIRRKLPFEDLLYVADSGHIPYGSKPRAYVRRRSGVLSQFLVEQGVKAIVIACNTATGAAASYLRSKFTIPIVAMEPAVKPATAATRVGSVGVLATVGTLATARFAALLEQFGGGVRIVVQGCPGLVEQVEDGDLAGRNTRDLVERYTAPLLAAGVDVIVLGCTHYVFLKPLISDVVGPDVTLIDTGEAVARQVRRVLEDLSLLNRSLAPGREQFWTTGDAGSARDVTSLLWGRPAIPRQLNI